MNMAKITLDHIGKASQNNDLDAALKQLMDIAGVTTGDVAAQVFSGFDWAGADQWSRVERLARWIRAEKAFCE
jgi:hypothetical protein